MRIINNIVVHCTATDIDVAVQSILNYWKQVLKWKNPGYHYLIDYKGNVHILLPESRIANGVSGHNSDSIHVSYIGGVDKNGKAKDTRSPAQETAMLKLLVELRGRYPKAKVLGHRDLSPDRNKDGKITPDEWLKECPSFDVATWLNPLKVKVA